MGVGQVRGHTAALGADQEPFFDQERFVNFFQGARIFTHGSGQRANSHRPPFEGSDERTQNLVVYSIQPPLVNLQFIQRETRDFQVDASVSQHLRKVPHPLQERIGDTRRTAASQGNLIRRIPVNLQRKDAGAAQHNLLQIIRIIILQGTVDAKAVPQGCCQQTAPRGGPHQRERIQRNANGTGARPLVNHDINHIILHGGVQIFLHFGRKPMNFVNKKHIPRLKGSEKAGQISRLVQNRTGSHLHVHPHLIGDDMRQRGFSQAGRAMEKNMVQGLPAQFGGFYINGQVGDNFLLAGKIPQLLRADNSVKFIIFALCCVVWIEFVHDG